MKCAARLVDLTIHVKLDSMGPVTQSMTPILLGEDYQHLYFWIQAARLFMEDDPAEVVYVEHPIIQAFDDVVAVNRVPLFSHDNRLIEVDHYQLKYHVDGRETIRALDLSTPSFIGATKHSLLDRAFRPGRHPAHAHQQQRRRDRHEQGVRGRPNLRSRQGPGGVASSARQGYG